MGRSATALTTPDDYRGCVCVWLLRDGHATLFAIHPRCREHGGWSTVWELAPDAVAAVTLEYT